MEDVLLKTNNEETSMSALKPTTPLASRETEQPKASLPDINPDVEPATAGIPLTVRTRHKVLRMAPPIDDGFRPFRVF
jgi:hypothetical protein